MSKSERTNENAAECQSLHKRDANRESTQEHPNRYQEAADCFKALGDPNRLAILMMLREGELCACKLLGELQISQPTLSHHLKILCERALVSARKEGKWMYYSLREDTFEILHEYCTLCGAS